MPEPVSVLAIIEIVEGAKAEKEVDDGLQEIKDRTPGEGALQYDIEKDGRIRRITERWPSLRALKEGHLETPAFKETFGQKIAPYLAKDLIIELARDGVEIGLDAPYDD